MTGQRFAVGHRSALSKVDDLGAALVFVGQALRAALSAPIRQGRETLRVTTEVGLGTGVLAMFGGSLAILGFITLFAGATVAVQGYNSLGDIGVEALTGFLAAYVNIRVVAPVTAGVGLAATIGASWRLSKWWTWPWPGRESCSGLPSLPGSVTAPCRWSDVGTVVRTDSSRPWRLVSMSAACGCAVISLRNVRVVRTPLCASMVGPR